TNWLIETVCLIYSKGDPKWIQSEPIWDRSPWVENKYGYELLKEKEGPLPFGSWFDHTRGWMSMRDKENFLILSYEEMKWFSLCMVKRSVTGDWKNHFTVAQAEIFDKLFQEKMADLPQELFPWE
ncbi:SULT2A1, partial [Cervus elaphus hippelaphus]